MNNPLFHVLQCLKRKGIIPINRVGSHYSNFTLPSLVIIAVEGTIYHDLGESFNSPTVNLMFYVSDFFTFSENLHDALESNIVEYKNIILEAGWNNKVTQWGNDKDKLHILSNL